MIEREDRTERLVLEANRNHWNTERGPRLERVIFRNDISPAEALELCMSREGEVDIVTEVSPGDAARVQASQYADLVAVDANRVLVGIINRSASPLDDTLVRKALNLAVDTQKVIEQGLLGYARPLSALTPSWCSGFPQGAQPYGHNPEQARQLVSQVGWPEGRSLRLAAPRPLEGIARMMASDIEAALGISVDVGAVPDEQLLAGARRLMEKKLPLPWDILVHGWFDLSSEAPPAVIHREFFGMDGAFRAGPVLPMFDALFSEMARELDPAKLVQVAERIDRYVFDEALAIFLCAPQALYAVNKHVHFGPYRTTFELADTEVSEEHWSRTGTKAGTQTALSSDPDKPVDFAGGSSGNAC